MLGKRVIVKKQAFVTQICGPSKKRKFIPSHQFLKIIPDKTHFDNAPKYAKPFSEWLQIANDNSGCSQLIYFCGFKIIPTETF